MNEINGIELGEKVKALCPEADIIYTTSYEQYCMQAINEIHAFSYLSKPVEKKKLEKQILELMKKQGRLPETEVKIFDKIFDSNGRERSALKLNLKDIIYFEYIKTKRRASVIMENKSYEYPCVMEKLSKELEEYGFAVNCRGNLVNLRHVAKIKGYELHMDNGKVLSLSQKRVAEFKEKMNDFLHNNI